MKATNFENAEVTNTQTLRLIVEADRKKNNGIVHFEDSVERPSRKIH